MISLEDFLEDEAFFFFFAPRLKQSDELRVGERDPVDLGCHIEKIQSMCQEGLECPVGLGGLVR